MTRVPDGVPRRPAFLLVSPALALVLMFTFAGVAHGRGVAGADAPGTQRPIGYDVSYPQCDEQLPTNAAYTIVGVNGGRVHSPNPCLDELLAWAGPETDFYANTGNPGPQLSEYWPVGQQSPRVCTAEDIDSLDCAYDYGWNAAQNSYATAVAAYVSLGWADADAERTPVDNRWWLDVEVANSWRADADRNVASLQGAVDYLESVGAGTVGFYSAPRMWRAITGGTDAFADHPSWVAGASTLRQAMAVCQGEGITGGPVEMAQYFVGGFDANHRC